MHWKGKLFTLKLLGFISLSKRKFSSGNVMGNINCFVSQRILRYTFTFNIISFHSMARLAENTPHKIRSRTVVYIYDYIDQFVVIMMICHHVL